MALATIISDNELTNIFGSQSTSDMNLLRTIRDQVEQAVRAYVRHDITQPSSDYVEYYPRRTLINPIGGEWDEWFDIANTAVASNRARSPSSIIVLRQKYVRTITDVWEDLSANFGKGSNDFDSTTKLTEGTDYVLDLVKDDFCDTGRLIRLDRAWPSTPGTVKVQYMAGLTQTELNDQFQFVKLAILDEIDLRFRYRKSWRDQAGPGAGPISSFSISGDFTERYDTSVVNALLMNTLLPGTKKKLQPIRHRMVAL